MFRTVLRDATAGVALAGIALTAPVAVLPMKAAAQQVAANTAGAPTPPAPNFAACEKIKDPAKAAQCSHDAVMQNLRERNEAALAGQKEAAARSAAADAQVACVNDITALRRNDTFGSKATEIARELVKASGRPVADLDACRLRDGIRAGLKQLKLLPGDRASLN
jgi:hypothetical protein